MKTLDKYVAKNFIIGYLIAFGVLLGLRILIDLFVNLDEFTEHANLGTLAVIKNITIFYILQSTLYFRDFAGIITVLAAVFSVGKMVRSNEFVAMMASGVSLKRIIAPIVFLSVVFTGLLVVDQEFIIPPLGEKLVREHDEVPGQETYSVRFLTDKKGSLIFAKKFKLATETLHYPNIITRQKMDNLPIWKTKGWIQAGRAVYDANYGRWNLVNGRIIKKDSNEPPQPIHSYKSDIEPREIPVRIKSEYKTLLSWSQLNALQKQGSEQDLAQLLSQKHFRVTDPVINLTMLLIALPVLVCRDPKAMKSAVMISFGLTGACLVTTFICKMLATEVVFGNIYPALWAWVPVFIFFPIAFAELDIMKT